MSTELIPITEVQRLAKAVVASRMFPDIKDEAQAFALMALCQAEGLHPMQAVRRFHLIQGRPSMKADAMLAEFQRQGGKVKWVRTDHECCEAVFTAPSMIGETTVKWTVEDAKRAKLTSDMWSKYPRQMLRSRVISEGIRLAMPSVVVGIYSEEEAMDFGNGNKPTEVAIVKQAPKAATRGDSEVSTIATGTTSTNDPKAESSPYAGGAAPSGDAAQSMATSDGGQLPESMPDRIRTSDAELAELAEPEDGEDVDYVECWDLKQEGSKKAHTLVSEWVPKGMCQRRTNRQNAKLNVLRNMLELTTDQWHAALKKYYNKESSRDLSIEEATDLISRMETRYNQRTHKTPALKAAAKEQMMATRAADMAENLEVVAGVTAVDLVQKTFNGATVVK